MKLSNFYPLGIAVALGLSAFSAGAVTVTHNGADYMSLAQVTGEITVSTADPIVIFYYHETTPLYEPGNPFSGGEYLFFDGTSYSVDSDGLTPDGDVFYRKHSSYSDVNWKGNGLNFFSVAKGSATNAAGTTHYDFFELTVDLAPFIEDDLYTTDFVTYTTGPIASFTASVDFYAEINWFEYVDYGYGPEYFGNSYPSTGELTINYVAPVAPVTPVPVPAGGLMLIASLGHLGWRFKRA